MEETCFFSTNLFISLKKTVSMCIKYICYMCISSSHPKKKENKIKTNIFIIIFHSLFSSTMCVIIYQKTSYIICKSQNPNFQLNDQNNLKYTHFSLLFESNNLFILLFLFSPSLIHILNHCIVHINIL